MTERLGEKSGKILGLYPFLLPDESAKLTAGAASKLPEKAFTAKIEKSDLLYLEVL